MKKDIDYLVDRSYSGWLHIMGKLEALLIIKDIKVIHYNYPNNNIGFQKEDQVYEISEWCFYGVSRLCYITDTSSVGIGVKLIPVSDEDWIFNYIKPIIEKQFI